MGDDAVDRHGTPGDERRGLAYAAAAAIIYGLAYPVTAIALRSFTPLAVAGIACTLALPIVLLLAASGILTPSAWRPSRRRNRR